VKRNRANMFEDQHGIRHQPRNNRFLTSFNMSYALGRDPGGETRRGGETQCASGGCIESNCLFFESWGENKARALASTASARAFCQKPLPLAPRIVGVSFAVTFAREAVRRGRDNALAGHITGERNQQ
jgi:hypothetical protein